MFLNLRKGCNKSCKMWGLECVFEVDYVGSVGWCFYILLNKKGFLCVEIYVN